MTRRTGLGVLAAGLAALGAPGAAASELERSVHAAAEAPLHDTLAIVLHTPRDGGSYASPLGIDIGFQAAGGAISVADTLRRRAEQQLTIVVRGGHERAD